MDTRPALFSIPELFHAVLLFLPLRDLLRLQRVCRLWKYTTEHSLPLQKKLFFHPVSDQNQEPEFNPLLRELFRPAFHLLRRPGNELYGRRDETFDLQDDVYALTDWRSDNCSRERVLYPGASWRRMFPIQPPARIDSVTSEGGCCRNMVHWGVIADRFQHLQERGATMGFLWDVAIHVLDKDPSESVVDVEWHMFPPPLYDSNVFDDRNEWIEEALEKGQLMRNTITVRGFYSAGNCNPPKVEPSGLSRGYFNPDIIKWGRKPTLDREDEEE